MKTDELLTPEIWQQIKTSREVRLGLASSLYLFAHIYFGEYMRYETAPFQQEMYKLLADSTVEYLAIVAFRGSGKSTIATQIFPIWALLSTLNKKYVLIISLNQNQAQNHLQNIKRQIESNDLLRKDFGPIEEGTDEWGSMSLVFPKLGARISAASMNQGVRGTRHGSHRPDLIICDDIEDSDSTSTSEGRNKTYQWFSSEILPLGDKNTKFVIVGNLLHEDSLMMRIRRGIEANEIDGEFRMYPLLNGAGECLWSGKYPTSQDIEHERRRLNNRVAWHREYLLQILPTDDQVVYREWLRNYKQLPDPEEKTSNYRATYLGIDLAISQKQSADYTSMVAIHVYGQEEMLAIYVNPLIVNGHLTHQQTLDKIDEVVERLGGKNLVEVIVEDVGYQASVIEQLNNKNFRVEAFKVHGVDKRSRLISVSHLFENRKVLFPDSPLMRELINQLVGFGTEKHDDLMDALVMTLTKALKYDKPISVWIPRGHDYGPEPLTADLMDKKF
jgi:predicted phage terminase large subunit-like protein